MGSVPYLVEVAAALWPGTARPVVNRGLSAEGRQTFMAVPRASAPSMLLPRGRAAAAGAVRAYGGHGSSLNRLKTRVTAGLLSLGLGDLVFPDRISAGPAGEGISAELARVLGVPVEVAVRGGPPRANRKPVLAVLAAEGKPLAFAKLGVTPLTERLVHAEAEALRRLAGVHTDVVRVPALIHCGPWRDMVLLVQKALPVQRPQRVDGTVLIRAMREIGEAFGTTTAAWGTSEHAAGVRARLDATPPSQAARCLAEAVEALAAQELPLRLGCWHGDWTPWNCSAADGAVLVWDWERFGASGVPLGFDVLNYDLQGALAGARTPSTEQPSVLLGGAAKRLAPLGLTAAQAHLTAVAYLIEIANRYLADDQAAAGARVGAVDTWLLPVIARATAELPSNREKSNS